jgi:hypothetical protein
VENADSKNPAYCLRRTLVNDKKSLTLSTSVRDVINAVPPFLSCSPLQNLSLLMITVSPDPIKGHSEVVFRYPAAKTLPAPSSWAFLSGATHSDTTVTYPTVLVNVFIFTILCQRISFVKVFLRI